MSYRLLKSDKKCYQIMHPDGTKITVARSGLSKDLQTKIDELPKYLQHEGAAYAKGGEIEGYADGGMVDEPNLEYRKKAESFMQSEIPDLPVEEKPLDKSGILGFLKSPDQQITTEQDVDRSPGQDMIMEETPVDTSMSAMDPVYDKGMANSNSYAANAMKMANDYETQIKNSQLELEKDRAAQQAEMAAIIQEGNKIAAIKEDPERIYKEGGHNKWLAAVAIGLGASGGGANPGLEIVNSRIQRDIEAQRNDKNSLYNAYLQKFKSAETAHNLTAQNLLGRAQNAAQIYQAKMGANNVGMQQNQFTMGLQMQRQALQEKLGQDVATRQLVSKGIRGGRLTPEQQAALPEQWKKHLLPDGSLAPRAPSEKDLEQIQATNNIKQGLQELIARAGTTVPGSIQDRENKQKILALQMQFKNAYTLGALSKEEWNKLDELVADPGAFRTEAAKAQLNSSINSMNQLEDSVYRKLGRPPMQRPALVTGGKLTLNK